MRLFVAVEIDDDSRRVATETAAALESAVGPGLRARWVAPENMHLTVRFIGHVDDDLAPSVIDALAAPLEIPSFDVEFGSCGSFPPSGQPRVFWIGLAHGMAGLTAIHEAMNGRLRPFGFEPERRAFSAHLTLARIKEAPTGTWRLAREALRRVAPPAARFHVTRATIFRSHLSPKGSRYEPVAFAQLTAGS